MERELLVGVPAIRRFLADDDTMTERQVRDWIEKGDLPSFKIRGRICARKSTLRQWLANLENEAA